MMSPACQMIDRTYREDLKHPTPNPEKKIAILTSGGDAPGMNAAIRAAVRIACDKNWSVIGYNRGYEGLIEKDYSDIGPRDVSNIIHRGGTILKTSRSSAFKTKDGQALGAEILNEQGIEALIVIGGDGSFRGAHELSKVWKGQLVGIPATIDNDVYGSDYTIGFDTAVNTALEAIDKIRDTADAHDRFFLIEVMGRHSGFIALAAGLGGGAEMIFIPEKTFNTEQISQRLLEGKARGKSSQILVVAEGCKAHEIAEKLKKEAPSDYRVAVLSYIQRGGSPSALDRVLATKLASYAIDVIVEGQTGVMVGEVAGHLKTTPFKDTFTIKKPLDPYLTRLVDPLAT